MQYANHMIDWDKLIEKTKEAKPIPSEVLEKWLSGDQEAEDFIIERKKQLLEEIPLKTFYDEDGRVYVPNKRIVMLEVIDRLSYLFDELAKKDEK